ncbi:2,5-diamino-6-(ribosylamino)-4(3H)-pyrimidinone 5'-phosphate reductase [Vermiconidia calcicola]|uniref:2,5-diamino-6-(Ribosylamino)-4(3H)-pyrimidinone 5'-phosphate reductase n=1 Tax=Vermiconidia calcicola TaxID=1690605 RepID=A0ACC3NGD3_9PEZI|nr:2,5-diamino-6-(ribosylamino)-4(3H)-pyrimidinone 5'-phosphate reductase [Vermiconidia calcicola]
MVRRDDHSSRVRTTLSGPETKNMTHYLRLHHDAILVGVGTAIADDPSLTCRYPGVSLDAQPRPVVVDPHMRWDTYNSKVHSLAIEKKGKAPWVVHASQRSTSEAPATSGIEHLLVGKDGLQAPDDPSSPDLRHIEWHSILKALSQKGIQSVMIEGGATIINDLLSKPNLVDSVIVTIAPTWLGQGGVAVSPIGKVRDGERVNAASLHGTVWRQFGHDAVLFGSLG